MWWDGMWCDDGMGWDDLIMRWDGMMWCDVWCGGMGCDDVMWCVMLCDVVGWDAMMWCDDGMGWSHYEMEWDDVMWCVMLCDVVGWDAMMWWDGIRYVTNQYDTMSAWCDRSSLLMIHITSFVVFDIMVTDIIDSMIWCHWHHYHFTRLDIVY